MLDNETIAFRATVIGATLRRRLHSDLARLAELAGSGRNAVFLLMLIVVWGGKVSGKQSSAAIRDRAPILRTGKTAVKAA